MRLFSQLRWYFVREWRRYAGAVSLLMMVAFLQLLPPKIVGVIVDGVTKHTLSNRQIVSLISLMLLIAVVVYLLRYFWRLLLFGASYQLAVELRSAFYRQLSHQSAQFYLRHRTGDLMARATNDVDRVVYAAGEGVLTLVDALMTGLAVLTVMSVQISAPLTLLALLPMPLMAVVVKRYGDQLYKRFALAQAAFSSLNDEAQESLSSIRMIKSFGLETQQLTKFADMARQASEKNIEVAQIDARFDPVIYMAIGLSNLLAIAGGSWLVWHHAMTLGQLTSFVMYLGLMIWPMLALAWMFNIVERGSSAWHRINSLLTEKPTVTDGTKTLPEGCGVLQVSVMTFSYATGAHPALKNINFSLRPGEMLGLCGVTGAGKSTIFRLLQRHFDITQGEIRYHGLCLSSLQLDSWRGRLAVVSQEPFLFSDTVAANIALGRPHAAQAEIERVAKLACIDEDILTLPQGYQTWVGERGVMLSGGQKQRIAIARALLLNADILLLDDALSAVDGKTAYFILKNLRHYARECMVITSAHRLSTLIEANEILVIKNGSIIQRGNHSSLLKQNGWYSDMYHYQQLQAALNEENSKPEIGRD